MLFWAGTYLGILQEKINMVAANMTKFKLQNLKFNISIICVNG